VIAAGSVAAGGSGDSLEGAEMGCVVAGSSAEIGTAGVGAATGAGGTAGGTGTGAPDGDVSVVSGEVVTFWVGVVGGGIGVACAAGAGSDATLAGEGAGGVATGRRGRKRRGST
jgi:hypothetical protein